MIKRNHAATNRCSAFTLVELLLVILLMTLMTGFVTLYFAGNLTRSKVSASARDISGNIRYARAVAAERQEEQTFLLDLDSRTFGISGRVPKALPPGITVTVSDPFAGEITRGKYRLRLLPSGSVLGGSILLSRGGTAFTVSPDPVVGVRVVKE